MGRKKINQSTIDAIQELAKQGLNAYEIADKVGVNAVTVYTYAKQVDGFKYNAPKNKKITKEQLEQIAEMQMQGMKVKDIADKLEFHKVSISKYRKEIDEIMRSKGYEPKVKIKKITDDRIIQMAEMRIKGMSNKEIANEMGIHHGTVEKRQKEINEIIRSKGYVPKRKMIKMSDDKMQRIAELKIKGMTYSEIAEEIGISYNTIDYHRKEIDEIMRSKGYNPKRIQKKMTNEELQQIAEMKIKGMSNKEIAYDLKINTATIHRYQKEIDEIIRSRGHNPKRQQKKVTDDELRKIAEMRIKGIAYSKIAEEIGINRKTIFSYSEEIKKIMQSMKPDYSDKRAKKITDEKLEQIAEMQMQGFKRKEIASKLGVSKYTLNNHRNKIKEIMRSKGWSTNEKKTRTKLRTRNKITDELLEQIAEMRINGIMVKEIAYTFGISKDTISRHHDRINEIMRSKGYKPIEKGHRKLTPNKLEEIAIMRLKGMYFTEIAKEVGVDKNTLSRHRSEIDRIEKELSNKGVKVEKVIREDRREPNDTICWDCKNAVPMQGCKCTWSTRFIPVDGWNAKKTKKAYGTSYVTSYMVYECPLFKKG